MALINKSITATVLSVILITLSGCASTMKTEAPSYDTVLPQKYPNISLDLGRPSAELANKCRKFDAQSSQHNCSTSHIPVSRYQKELSRTNLFQNVFYPEGDSDYKVTFATNLFYTKDATELSKAALAATTALLVPVSMNRQASVEATVYWRNKIIKIYTFSLPYKQKLSIFHDSNQAEKDFVNSVVSNFINSAQTDELFSSDFLVRTLDSTD